MLHFETLHIQTKVFKMEVTVASGQTEAIEKAEFLQMSTKTGRHLLAIQFTQHLSLLHSAANEKPAVYFSSKEISIVPNKKKYL